MEPCRSYTDCSIPDDFYDEVMDGGSDLGHVFDEIAQEIRSVASLDGTTVPAGYKDVSYLLRTEGRRVSTVWCARFAPILL